MIAILLILGGLALLGMLLGWNDVERERSKLERWEAIQRGDVETAMRPEPSLLGRLVMLLAGRKPSMGSIRPRAAYRAHDAWCRQQMDLHPFERGETGALHANVVFLAKVKRANEREGGKS